MKICPNCGTQSETSFCPNCGTQMPAENEVVIDNSEQVTEEPLKVPPITAETQTKEEAVFTKNKKPKKSKKKIGCLVVVIIVILIAIVGCFGEDDTASDPSSTEPATATETTEAETAATTEATTEAATEPTKKAKFNPDNYKNIAYSKLARNPEKYEYQLVKNSGKVIQVIEGDDEIQLRVAIDGDYDKVVLLGYDPAIRDSRILEDDYITYYGMSMGTVTYKSTMGGDITIPAVYATKIKLK